MKKSNLPLYRLAAVAFSLLTVAGCATTGQAPDGAVPKNILILFTDGTGTAQLESARLYNQHINKQGLHLSDVLMQETRMGMLATYSADSLVTDSAAAGSAMANGHKAKNGSVGVDARGEAMKSAGELAHDKGMFVAIASNATVTDASPAAFGGAHVANRKEHDEIARQLAYAKPDILLGGGRTYFTPEDQKGSRKDGNDLVAWFAAAGYETPSDTASLMAAKGPRMLGLFSKKDMDFATDRDSAKEPTLPQMLSTILRVAPIDQSKGLFMLLENEHTDTAGHRTDIANAIHHLIEFDQAVKMAHDFQKAHPDTLLIVTTDHETGGLSLTYALKDLTSFSSKNRIEPTFANLDKVRSIGISTQEAAKKLGDKPDDKAIDQLMVTYYPGFILDNDLRQMLKNGTAPSRTNNYPGHSVLGEMVARNTLFYWGTSGHTNQWAFVLAVGPGAEHFHGFMDNTEFGKRLLGLIQQR